MKVNELIELLKTVDADREAVFTDGMPVNGIHGELDEGALPLEVIPWSCLASPSRVSWRTLRSMSRCGRPLTRSWRRRLQSFEVSSSLSRGTPAEY